MTPDADTPLAAAEPVSQPPGLVVDRHWPAIVALTNAWICPAITARRTCHVKLFNAWGVHALAVILALLALDLANVAIQHRHRPVSLLRATINSTNELIDEIGRNPTDSVLAVTATAALVEGGMILLATLLMPWGARDEPAGDSFRHALRRVWLHSGHIALLIMLVGMIVEKLERQRYHWHYTSGIGNYHTPPIPTPGPNPTQQELEEYTAAFSAYHRTEIARINTTRPLSVKYMDEIVTYSVILACIWFLWALLRGLGADRPVRTPEHPPMCRACGYNLTGLPPDGRCPECGRPVADSIGPDASPGAAWERPANAGGGYMRTLYAWIWSAQTEASDLCLTPARRRHPTFLVINVIICGMAAGVGVAAIFGLEEFPDPQRELFTIVLPICGAIWATFLLLFAAGAAFLPAMVMLARDRRNLLSGTFQAACYCSGWLLAWTAVGAATLAVSVLAFDELVRPFARIANMDPHILALFINLAVHAICGLRFIVAVYRASAGVRYASR